MNIDEFCDHTFEVFDDFMPLAWLKHGLISTLSDTPKPNARRRPGLDIFAFIRRGIIAPSLVVAAATVASLPSHTNVYLTKQVGLERLVGHDQIYDIPTISAVHSVTNMIRSDVAVNNRFNTLRQPFLCLTTTSAQTANSTWNSRAFGLTNRPVNLAQTQACIQTLFTPTEEQRARIQDFTPAIVSAGISNILAYENEQDDLIIEAGPPARTLTFVIKKNRILAMYRVDHEDGTSEIVSSRLSATPSAEEISAITRSYVAPSWPT